MGDKAQKLAAKEERKNERACNAALKEIVKDDALKKPQTAYWLWLGDNREKIASTIGSSKPTDVSKKAGEMWKTLSDAARAPYEQKAKADKEAYDKYISSEEGAAALKKFKDAKQATMDQFKPKETPEAEAVQEAATKRKVNETVDEEGEATGTVAPTKKARGRPPQVPAAKLGA